MMSGNKEKLITESKRKELGESPIFDVKDFVLRDQEILTSDFFETELEAKIHLNIENGYFIILNDDDVNAYAYTKDGCNVIALTRGSIYKCLYAADLFMLKEDFFPEIEDSEMPGLCYKKVTTSLFHPVINDKLIEFPVSGDKTRRNIGYIITALALKHMVYHEIGHHTLGHLKQQQDIYGLQYGEVHAVENDDITADRFKKMEIEADIFSVQRIMDELEDLEAKWNYLFEVELMHMEYASLLIVALVIVKECLAPEIVFAEEIEQSKYLPKFIRLIIEMSVISSANNNKLISEFKDILRSDSGTREIIENEIGSVLIDDPDQLQKALIAYMNSIAVFSEQTYKEIFYGTSSPLAFWDDLKAAEWWKRLQ